MTRQASRERSRMTSLRRTALCIFLMFLLSTVGELGMPGDSRPSAVVGDMGGAIEFDGPGAKLKWEEEGEKVYSLNWICCDDESCCSDDSWASGFTEYFTLPSLSRSLSIIICGCK